MNKLIQELQQEIENVKAQVRPERPCSEGPSQADPLPGCVGRVHTPWKCCGRGNKLVLPRLRGHKTFLQKS